MRTPSIDAFSTVMMTKQTRMEKGRDSGLFGDIFNMKLQNVQSKAEAGSEEAAEDLQLLANALRVLEELQKQIGTHLSEAQQELLQQAVDLLNKIDEKFLYTDIMIEPALKKVATVVELLISDGEVKNEEVQLILEELKAVLKQYESNNQTGSAVFPMNTEHAIFISGQIPVRPMISNRSDAEFAQVESSSLKQESGLLGSLQDQVDTEEARPVSVRLEASTIPKEAPALMTSTAEGTESKGSETGNVQPKTDVTQAQSSIANRNEIEEAIVRLAETGSNERRAKELIRQFTNILQKSHFSQALQTKSLTIRLYPEHLGSLRIELVQRDGAMIARILASTNMAKDMLDSQIHQLRQAFVQQNIQVDKVDVSIQEGLDKYSSQDQRDRDQGQTDSDQDADKDSFTREDDEVDFSKFLQKVLFEMEV